MVLHRLDRRAVVIAPFLFTGTMPCAFVHHGGDGRRRDKDMVCEWVHRRWLPRLVRRRVRIVRHCRLNMTHLDAKRLLCSSVGAHVSWKMGSVCPVSGLCVFCRRRTLILCTRSILTMPATPSDLQCTLQVSLYSGSAAEAVCGLGGSFRPVLWGESTQWLVYTISMSLKGGAHYKGR